MTTYIAPPTALNGSTEQQLSDIYTYLFRLSQTLNLEFEKTTPAAIFEEVNKAIEGADSGLETNKAIADNYQQLKALVIKTADYTSSYGTANVEAYEGYFVAKSEFGEYKEQTNSAITTNSTGIEQMYEYTASLGILGNGESDVDITEISTWSQAYIKSGLIYYDQSTPKYGIAVGNVGTLVTVGDDKVVDLQNLLATFTSDRMSFWQGGNEVAYLSSGSMYFPSANITGGSIEIGTAGQYAHAPFYVDTNGNLTCRNASVSGTLTAGSGSQIGNWNINTAIYNGKTSLSDTSHSGIYMGTDGLYLGDGSSTETFVKLLPNGTMEAKSATITGTLHAGSGSTIADWTVGKTTGTNPVSYLYTGSRSTYSSTASGIYIGSDGISMGSPTSTASGAVGVQISSSGALTCRGATVKGNITADSLTLGTGVYIDGSNITSNSITTTQIKANTITASNIAAGTITGTQIAANTITSNNLSVGSISADKIGTGTLTAGNISVNGAFTVKNGTSTVGAMGYVSTGGNNYGVGLISSTLNGWILALSNGVKIGHASGPQVTVLSNQVYMTEGSDGIYFLGNAFYPASTSQNTTLGTSGGLWSNLYCSTGPWSGSDRNNKENISYNIDDYLEVFDKLQPASYKYKDGQSGRTHIGFVAQDVEQAILNSGMTTTDYACISIAPKENGEGNDYALRYEEFIALAVLKIKKLEARIAALEGA